MASQETIEQRKNSPLIRLIKSKMYENQMSLVALAEKTQYTSQVISHIIKGRLNIPLNKIPAFAKALEIDETRFFRLAMEHNNPELFKAVKKLEKKSPPLTENEITLINALREASDNVDPEFPDDWLEDFKASIKKLAEAKKEDENFYADRRDDMVENKRVEYHLPKTRMSYK